MTADDVGAAGDEAIVPAPVFAATWPPNETAFLKNEPGCLGVRLGGKLPLNYSVAGHQFTASNLDAFWRRP